MIKALSRLTAFELTKGQRTKVTGTSSGPPLSPKPESPAKLPLPFPTSSLSQTTGPILKTKTPASTNLGNVSEFRRPLAPAPVSSQQQVWPLSQSFSVSFLMKRSFICFVGKSMTPHGGNTILFRSSQQLSRLRLGTSKGFLS